MSERQRRRCLPIDHGSALSYRKGAPPNPLAGCRALPPPLRLVLISFTAAADRPGSACTNAKWALCRATAVTLCGMADRGAEPSGVIQSDSAGQATTSMDVRPYLREVRRPVEWLEGSRWMID